MIGDREGRRVFMADRGGYVHIYELMSNVNIYLNNINI
jgi:hypothetical protein